MKKYLKSFTKHQQYLEYINGDNKILPNVSYCQNKDEVHYNPLNVVRNDIISYYTYNYEKLSMLNADNFNVAIVSHTFDQNERFGVIEFEDDVTTIGYSAFSGTPITSIKIPNTVTTIGNQAFKSCGLLHSIILPENITSIGSMAFIDCPNLASVTIKATTPPSLTQVAPGAYATFNNNASGRKIYVPEESLDAYRSAPGWISYAGSIEPISTNN